MTSNLDAKPEEELWGGIGRTRRLLNLVLISLSNLFGGVSLSLLAPFYSTEALIKGVSVSKSGLVVGSVFLTTVLCTPAMGRGIHLLGARRVLLLGSVVCAAGNATFGSLYLVQVTALH
jgi:MFS family permease